MKRMGTPPSVEGIAGCGRSVKQTVVIGITQTIMNELLF